MAGSINDTQEVLRMSIPRYDELYVISDLHMGGGKGFQIFNQGDTLAKFIRSLIPRQGRIALVVNGDIVDFLAEKPSLYFDVERAIDKLERIYNDPAFNMVWKALAEYVQTPGHVLVLVLGNHDVELALPPVESWLVEKLSGGDDGARGRVISALYGAGFLCQVGDRRVLCVHGNEVDPWNVVDYLALLQTARALNRAEPPPVWDANGGTRMVIDIMNSIKANFPFVDLLKPEAQAVLPVVAALDPSQLGKITQLARVYSYTRRDQKRMEQGFLSVREEAAEELPSEAEFARDFLNEHFDTTSASSGDSVDDLLANAYDNLAAGTDPKDLAAADGSELLGIRDVVKDGIDYLKRKKEDVLRTALLKLLKDDRTFDVQAEDDQFRQLDQRTGADVHYVISGHTHLAKALERRHPGTYYFNTGTWIRLIELNPESLADPGRFATLYQALGSRTLDDLDKATDPTSGEPLVRSRPHVASVVASDAGTVGQLWGVAADGTLVPETHGRLPEA